MSLEFLCSVNHPAEAVDTFLFLELGEIQSSTILQLRHRGETVPGNPALDAGTIRRRFVTRLKLRRKLLRHQQRFRSIIRGHSLALVASTEASTPTFPVVADASIPVELGKRTGNLINALSNSSLTSLRLITYCQTTGVKLF